jgi:hypothetical protein
MRIYQPSQIDEPVQCDMFSARAALSVVFARSPGNSLRCGVQRGMLRVVHALHWRLHYARIKPAAAHRPR